MRTQAAKKIISCGTCSARAECTSDGDNSRRREFLFVANDWCERGDSNPHGFTRQILSLVRLPIPPLSQVERRQRFHCNVKEKSLASTLWPASKNCRKLLWRARQIQDRKQLRTRENSKAGPRSRAFWVNPLPSCKGGGGGDAGPATRPVRVHHGKRVE